MCMLACFVAMPRAVCNKLQLRQLAATGDCKDAVPWALLTISEASLPSERQLPHSFP